MPIIETGRYNSLKEFIALISCTDLVVSGDTLAMHIAIALRKPVVAIFGPTRAQEVELYSRGKKVISNLEGAPCYKNLCEKEINCMEKINPDEVSHAIQNLRKRIIN